jgi:hypothetical protein
MAMLFHAFHHDERLIRRSSPSRKLLRLLLVVGLVLAAPVAAVAGGVYVAGQGTGLAQTFSHALADNPRKSERPFWVVVAGTDAAGLTKTRATPETRQSLKTAKERGAEVYVCRSDLVRAGIKDEELLDGVVSMYGYGHEDWSGLLPARRVDGIALPADMKQSQRILNTCMGDAKSGL